MAQKIPDKMPTTVKQLLKYNASQVGKGQIKEFEASLKHLMNVANKRITKLKATEYYDVSPAYLSLTESQRNKVLNDKPVFAIRDVNDLNKMKSDFAEVKRFLMTKTGSDSGWKRAMTKMENLLATEVGDIDFSSEEYKLFWRTINELTKSNETLYASIYKASVLSELYSSYVQKSPKDSFDKAYNFVKQEVSNLYEKHTTTKDLGFSN